MIDFQQVMTDALSHINAVIHGLALPLLNAVLEVIQSNPATEIATVIGFGVLIGVAVINLAVHTIRDQF